MAYSSQNTVDYFKAYQNYFWRWAEHGQVIEFANQKTICYRKDLSNILKELPNTTSLSLGTILLILCACKDDWETGYNAKQTLLDISYSLMDASSTIDDPDHELKIQAYQFLCIVNQLPYQYRSEMNRVLLLQSIFDALSVKGYHMGLLPLLKEFNSGEMDEDIFGEQAILKQINVVQDLAPLAAALSVFKDVESLVLKQRTGLTALPIPINIPQPEPVGKDLLAELENDKKTNTVSQLARKIMAALSIPMYLNSNNEQSLGGISDIANKGTYDKLLLSELAQDDLLLSARLANNEALFLKRETAPNHQVQQLGIIIDSTLKMWGSARIFAVAAALAFRESKEKNQQLKVWSLGGKHLSIAELETKKDTETLLEKMDPALHCGETLVKAFATHAEKNGRYILITSAHFLKDAAPAPYFLKIRDQLNYLITISASGHLQMIRFSKNQSKLIREAHIDLSDLVAHTHQKKIKQINQADLPAVLYEPEFPLYYPTSKIRLNFGNVCMLANSTAIGISIDSRLLFWPDKNLGAKELAVQLTRGQYCFGEMENTIFIMLIPENNKAIEIYRIDAKTLSHSVTEITIPHKAATDLQFIRPYFYFKSKTQLSIIDPRNGAVITSNNSINELISRQESVSRVFQSQLKRHLNNGYSTINSVKNIHVNTAGIIFSDKKEFLLVNDKFYWKDNQKSTVNWLASPSQYILKVDHLPFIRFTKFTWKNGSTATMDSRGILHLKSSNPHIPEIGIIMIVNQPTACWSADGQVSGSTYFTGSASAGKLKPSAFYEKYIQAFIDGLK
ncbi:hypothetical protein EZ456_00880 [Pedobacter psychrodurus]|uniref:Uncharacterized protein n=1 Tax=Pedobacter psychrodurus TaxID=2530456 RepID=A0A4R0Q8S5_9SPHI|nr:hypothetical protein [Pedobacter psychrodurus]TCD29602.1 hypothetical protein EZ456_00880 [Pedobacter psychrodurus]